MGRLFIGRIDIKNTDPTAVLQQTLRNRAPEFADAARYYGNSSSHMDYSFITVENLAHSNTRNFATTFDTRNIRFAR